MKFIVELFGDGKAHDRKTPCKANTWWHEVKHDVFANEFSKNYHRTFDKMCEDILIGK